MFNKKVIEEIYRNHSKPLEGSVHKEYNVGNDIILYVHQNGFRVVMSAINEKTDRQLNLMAAKYKDLIEGFKEISVLSSDKHLLKIDLIDKTKKLREDSLNKMKLRLEESIESDKKEIIEDLFKKGVAVHVLIDGKESYSRYVIEERKTES